MCLFLGTQNFLYENQWTFLFPGRFAMHTQSSFHTCEDEVWAKVQHYTLPLATSACCHTVWLCNLSGSQGWRMWLLLQSTSSELGSKCHGNWEWNGAKHQPEHWAKVCGTRKTRAPIQETYFSGIKSQATKSLAKCLHFLIQEIICPTHWRVMRNKTLNHHSVFGSQSLSYSPDWKYFISCLVDIHMSAVSSRTNCPTWNTKGLC